MFLFALFALFIGPFFLEGAIRVVVLLHELIVNIDFSYTFVKTVKLYKGDVTESLTNNLIVKVFCAIHHKYI